MSFSRSSMSSCATPAPAARRCGSTRRRRSSPSSRRRAPDIGSIARDATIDLAASPTFKFLDREQRPLIQRDLLDADPAPPPELIEHYGARAQMPAPIVRDGRLVGILSVHYAPGPRDWTAGDVAALERAAERVLAELD